MTRYITGWRRLVRCAALLTSLAVVTVAKCPWNSEGLKLWSDPTTWPDGQLPGPGADVIISEQVLLDEINLPDLSTITIQVGGALVWGNVDGITLNVSYIAVFGEFHMGSEKCRFKKNAVINLYGRSDSPLEVEGFGRKFLGVASGGHLEVHGLEKMSWTKLAHTLPRAADLDCAVFDLMASPQGQDRTQGLHVLIFTPDGSIWDYQAFDSNNYDSLPEFLSDLPENVIVGAAVKGSIGTPPDSVYTALEGLGATTIRSVAMDTTYAFIARIGDTSTADEVLQSNDPARLIDQAVGLAFTAHSTMYMVNGKINFKSTNLEAANPKITVQDDVSSWAVGDSVFITSTDFDWRQLEVFTVIACPECAPNQIRLDTPVQYMHYGELTLGVDQRAEVGLLSRNIKIQGQLEDECYFHDALGEELCGYFGRDTFGGHVKATMNSTVHIEGVELARMGQQHVKGSYPLHFHMLNDATGMWFRNNSIHHSLGRCVTIHATFYAEVSDIVCYLHLGHGMFLEDSVEQFNLINRNLIVGAEHGALLLSDKKTDWCGQLAEFCDVLSNFWITHANNNITNNVAAGSDGNCFMIVFATEPIGDSRNAPWIRNESSRYYPFRKFSGNVMHSCFKAGIFMDSRISTGVEQFNGVTVPADGIIPSSPDYEPRDPPNENGSLTWTKIENTTLYKNSENAWCKGGNLLFDHCSFADSVKGFTGGTIGKHSATKVSNSLFVADSDNKGQPFTFVENQFGEKLTVDFDHSFGKTPYHSAVGVGFYQGPIIVENCHFSRYKHVWWAPEWGELSDEAVRPGGALSWHRNNIYPTKPSCTVRNIKFDVCDNVNNTHWVFGGNNSLPDWFDKDGLKAQTFRDLDGSVTGQANTQVVINRPFYAGDRCSTRPGWNNMTACPYKYVQLEFMWSDGALDKKNKGDKPVYIRRDDVPNDVLDLDGKTKNAYLLRTHRSYTVTFNPDLGTAPIVYEVRGANVEYGDVVRVGICMPEGTTSFDVRSFHPNICRENVFSNATTLAEFDAEVSDGLFFWDAGLGTVTGEECHEVTAYTYLGYNEIRMLFFKMMDNGTRENEYVECPGAMCIRYRITRLDGSNVTRDCNAAPAYIDNTTPPPIPQPRACTGPDSNEGLGAVHDGDLVADPFNPTCSAPDSGNDDRGPREYRGCFNENNANSDVPFFPTENNVNTPSWCQDRCYNRGFIYAAVSKGRQCACGDTFGFYGSLADSKCGKACTGDSSSTCGGTGKMEVYTTGKAPPPSPTPCGLGGQGESTADGQQCLYMAYRNVSVGEAQRLCARLGGNLAAIQSQEKQTAMELYLRDKDIPDVSTSKVWIGLKHVTGSETWEQRDGTALGSFTNWKGTAGSDPLKHFVYVAQPSQSFPWSQSKDNAFGYPLCDVPATPPPTEQPCGFNQKGRRVGTSGTCYLVVDQMTSQNAADYACHKAGGTLANYASNRASQEVLAHALYRWGTDRDYWTAKYNRVMAWVDSTYTKTTVTKTDRAGALCVLEAVNSSHSCLSGWESFGESCYLNLATVVKSDNEGAELCESGSSGSSHVARVDSEDENNFLKTLIPAGSTSTSNVLLSLHYRSRDDNFVWANGQPAEFTNWDTGKGKKNLGEGSCAVLRPDVGWVNAKCGSLSANVVCEMPALVWE